MLTWIRMIAATALAAPAQPDIIVVLVDDLDRASLHHLSGITDLFKEGTEFT